MDREKHDRSGPAWKTRRKKDSPLASLYIHIPFCERKCPYCDFFSVEDTDRVEEFLAALAREIALRQADMNHVVFDTVFLGGGTPSILTPPQLNRILSALHAAFRIAPDAETTLEANPGTATQETLRAFHSLGVNRLSIGIQSFRDRELRFLGRIHDRADALRCLDFARAAGFENLGVDLIYSIPGQSLAEWEDTLETAANLAPQHLAAYSLIVEENTPLARLMKTGAARPTPTEIEARMYERTMELLDGRGYEHYEVSNYALPNFHCRHNRAYWTHQNYLGLGPSAHSFWKKSDSRTGTRWWNVSDLPAYMGRLSRNALPVESEEHVGVDEMISERIFLGLRGAGIDLPRLRLELGYDFEDRQGNAMQWVIAEGLAARRGDTLRLTPKGYLVCDEICARFLASTQTPLPHQPLEPAEPSISREARVPAGRSKPMRRFPTRIDNG